MLAFGLAGVAAVWFGAHIPVILYGVANTPLHVSYWSADEQSPANGALHVLKDRSILGLRNENTLYYGPVFAVLALPAVVADYSVSYVVDGIRSADAYKDKVVWDWGGILLLLRLTAVLVGLLGLLAVYLIFKSSTINPRNISWLPSLAAATLAVSFIYFEYASFFRHWIFVTVVLLWQLLLSIWLVEGKYRRSVLWVAEVVLAAASFGISYMSILYQVFWLPLLVYWFGKKEWNAIRAFALHAVCLVGLMALVVWWHPYSLTRMLGMIGLIDPGATGIIWEKANTSSKHSYLFYLQLTLVHVLPLVVAGVCAIWNRWRDTLKFPFLYLFLLPSLVNYLVFGWQAHHETRYMMPTIVLTILAIFVILSATYGRLGQKRYFFLWGFLGLFIVLNVVQIVGWTRMMAAGPVERSDIIPQILAWQEENPDARTLVIKGWPLGYVHTREAYEDYITRYNKSGYELWQYLRDNEAPEGVEPLNVYYLHEGEELTDIMKDRYDHIVRHVLPAVGDDLAWESPQDEFDIRPWNVWRYRDFQERYEIIK